MMAAQLFDGAKRTVPGLLAQISNGEFTGLLSWLREYVHSQGSFPNQAELLTAATGEPLNADFFITHLQTRYGD